MNKNCPSCLKPAKELIAGVCGRCRRSFEVQHKQKLDVKWEPRDFHYHAPQVNGEPALIMDEEDAAKSDLRNQSVETMDFFKRGFRLLFQYKGNLLVAMYAFALAHEWFDVAECETAKDAAVKISANPKKRAAMTKAIKHFQDSLGIGPGKGQRSQKGREEMAKARNKQLKPK